MSGIKEMTIATTGINFSRYFIHPEYENQEIITQKDIYWEIYMDYKLGERTAEKDVLIITQNIKLFRKKDKIHISGLIAKSTFIVTAGIPFDQKLRMLGHLININIGHLLGGWVVKQENISMSLILPSHFYRFEIIEVGMKKFIFEHWD